MPLIFPSHQGLILPVWRKWPDLFNGLAVCVGAAMPDVVDGIVDVYRGSLGQLYGHSLVGLFLFCLPGGLVLTRLIEYFGKRVYKFGAAARPLLRMIGRIGYYIERLNYMPERISRSRKRYLVLSFSICIGTFSHLLE